MSLKIKFLYLILFLWHCGMVAQDPYHISYDIDDHLPSSNIYSAFEDSKGYIWFASDVGVIRFNGYEFEHFSTDDGLGDNEIFKMYQDQKNRLWFLSLNGKLSYFKDNIFYNETNEPLLKALSHQNIMMDIHESPKGDIYFLYGDNHISTLSSDNRVQHSDVKGVGRSFSLWSEKGELHLLGSIAIKNLTNDLMLNLPDSLLSREGHRSARNHRDAFFFGSKHYIFQFRGAQTLLPIAELPKGDIIHLSVIDDQFWAGTRNGLFVQKNNGFTHYFQNEAVAHVLRDSQQNYWVSTLTSGIKFIPNINMLHYTFPTKNVKVNALAVDSLNKLWVGTEEGLFIKDLNRKSEPFSEVNQYRDNPIKKIRHVEDSTFVLARAIEVYTPFKHKTIGMSTRDIAVHNNQYYLAASDATYQFQPSEIKTLLTLKQPAFFDFKQARMRVNRRTNVLETSSKDVFVGTSRGLHSLSDQKSIQNPHINSSVLDLFFDKESNWLVMATNSQGVFILRDDQVLHLIDKKSGLTNNSCNAIEKISRNRYFIGTNQGLNLLEIKHDSILVTNYNNLLTIKNEIIHDLEMVGDQVYLATNKGMLVFSEKQLPKNNKAPKILIDNIKVNGQTVSHLDKLTFTENNISINYTGISYKDFGNIGYEYKFADETQWTKTHSRQINFKDLAAKPYSLTLRAAGSNNKYSEEIHIHFEILPPFWQNLWFLGAMLLLGLMFVFIIIKRRIKTIKSNFQRERIALQHEKDKTNLEKQMADLEQKVLRLQMNPHFIFNALNTIKGYYSGGEIKQANLYISRFSKLLRLILDSDERMISVSKEIKMIELYIQLIQLRYLDIFEYSITVEDGLETDEVGIPPLLLQPIVENAIIHGMAPNNIKGNLEISFSTKENYLVCVVRDNGVGLSNSVKKQRANHQSKALNITRERISLLNQQNNINGFVMHETKEPMGTEVIITFPIIKSF